MILRLQLNNELTNSLYDAMYSYIESNFSKISIKSIGYNQKEVTFKKLSIIVNDVNTVNDFIVKKMCMYALRDKLFTFICKDKNSNDDDITSTIQLKGNNALIQWNVEEYTHIETFAQFDDIKICLVSMEKVNLQNLRFLIVQIEQTIKLLIESITHYCNDNK